VEERAHLTASGPALLEAVLARIKAAEERLAATRCAPHHLRLAHHVPMLALSKEKPLLLTADQQLPDIVGGVSMLTLSKEKPLLLTADQQLPDNVNSNPASARAAIQACLCYCDHAALQLS